jgi:hypothetical protein
VTVVVVVTVTVMVLLGLVTMTRPAALMWRQHWMHLSI